MMNIQNHKTQPGSCYIGETALDAVSTAHQGVVLASVTNADYLLSDNGDLFWLIPPGYPMHRRSIQATPPLPRLMVGSKYHVFDHTMMIDRDRFLDFHQHSVWLSPTVTSLDAASRTRLSTSLPTTINLLLEKHIPSGLGCLITRLPEITIHRVEALQEKPNARLAEKAWPAIQGIIHASMVKDTNLINDNAILLVGLGEGLTPSGDDFLGGFFFSMHVLPRYDQVQTNFPLGTYSELIVRSKYLTNQISHTFLNDHADGYSVEPLHQLANGLLLGEPVDRLFLHMEKLISIGHSSGWDLLTGFLAGISVTISQ